MKFWVFLWYVKRISFERWGYHIEESHSFIRRIDIFLRILFELRRRSRLLLLVFKKIFSKVGAFSSCRFVRISLLVFSERLSSCLICFVIVVDSFFCIC